MTKSLERTVAIWFAIVALISASVGLFTFRSQSDASIDDAWVEHTHAVIQLLERTKSSLGDAESNVRAFVISGEPERVDVFDAERPRIEFNLREVERMAAGNPAQQRRAARLRAAVAREVDLQARVIRARKTGGIESVLQVTRSEPGRPFTDRAGAILDEMVTEERSLLDSRSRIASGSRERTFLLITLGMMTNLGILILVFRMIGRETARRGHAERALQSSMAEARTLAMVASRTHNAVLIVDASGRIRWANDGFARMTEYPVEEVIGREAGPFLLGPESDPSSMEHSREKLWAGQGGVVEVLHQARSGRKYWAALEVQPVPATSGELDYVIAIMSDVTERRRTDGRLAVQHAAMKILDKASSLDEAIAKLLPAIGENLGVDVVEYWTIDRTLEVLKMRSHWATSDRWEELFSGPSQEWSFARGVGLPGRGLGSWRALLDRRPGRRLRLPPRRDRRTIGPPSRPGLPDLQQLGDDRRGHPPGPPPAADR